MDKTRSDALNRIEAMRMDYARQLPGRIRGVAGEWSRLQDCGWDIEAIKGLAHQAHGLAGVAATFGFTEVSARARALEVFLDDLLEAAKHPSRRQWLRAAQLVADLERALPE